ncbi:MAG: hypothetical protein R6U95_06410 [Bacteroidales bacterium]
MKKIIPYTIFVLLFVTGTLAGYGQVNFFTENVDSSAHSFFDRNKTATFTGTYTFPNQTYGVSALIHNNEDYISYYVHAGTNIYSQKTITGTHIENQTQREIAIPYSEFIVHIGLAHAFTKNIFFYVHTGCAYTHNTFSPASHPQYIYSSIPKNMNALLGAGLFYITNTNWTFQLGMHSYKRNFLLGIGYTL